VFYRGDEDGSKQGLDITDTLDDDQLNYIEEEIKELEHKLWIQYGP
jgi:hypothetical protein